MPHELVSIATRDGECRTHVLTPDGAGPWPAVIVFMDALAIRPALVEMATRLASNGYVALLPDMFYRFGDYEPLVVKEVFAGNVRESVGPMMASTSPEKSTSDTEAFLAYLDSRSDVAGSKVGTVGFCMGGAMALRAAGMFPDRVGAVASFHGGNLATDEPDSPHLLAPKIKAEVLIAGADQDGIYPPEMEVRLREALDDAGVRNHCEIYKGALHGWMKTDFPIYNAEAAERGWREMLALFARNLK